MSSSQPWFRSRSSRLPACSSNAGASPLTLATSHPCHSTTRWSPTSSGPRAADADPAPVEEVLLLPPEHGSGGVRLGWEGAAAAEGVYRRCKKLAGYRRHVVLPPCRSRG